MRITKRDLYSAVEDFNKSNCKNTKVELGIEEANGGYQVVVRNKINKKTNKPYGNKYEQRSITYGFDCPRNVLTDFFKDQKHVKERVKYCDKLVKK